MPRLLRPIILGWVIVVAAICSSCAHQPASNAPAANVNAIEALNEPAGNAPAGNVNAIEAVGYSSGQNHTVTLPNAVPLDLIWITPGTFTMGSPDSETERDGDEGPQTAVAISQGFWLGKTLVTQGQYQALMGSNPSHFADVGPDAPVEQVSWDDAMAFCRKLTDQERAAGHLPKNLTFTLPTEAQWEYACRAGTTEPRYGNLDEIAWYGSNSVITENQNDVGKVGPWYVNVSKKRSSTHPVEQKQPNAWGLYDMLGNVWEWCSDWYGAYPGGNVTDPVGAPSGPYRVDRGGGWYSSAARCRSASRSAGDPGDRDFTIGFRVALAPSR
jgi:formylglycine-generating enzyme required for sulfatase activity